MQWNQIGALLAVLLLTIPLWPGCSGADRNRKTDAQCQIQAEQEMGARYPGRGYITGFGCSEQGTEAAKAHAKGAVAASVNSSIQIELESNESIAYGSDIGEIHWGWVFRKVRQTARFDGSDVIRVASGDLVACGELACALAVLSRREADGRLARPYDSALQRYRNLLKRCSNAHSLSRNEVFTSAFREAEEQVSEILRIRAQRIGLGWRDPDGFAEFHDGRNRLLHQAGKLRDQLQFAIRTEGASGRHDAKVSEKIVRAVKGIGVRSMTADSGGCTNPLRYQVLVRAHEMCESSYMGQVCKVRLDITGGRCGHRGDSFHAVIGPGEPGVHPRSRDVALRHAYENLLDGQILRDELRRTLARIIPNTAQ